MSDPKRRGFLKAAGAGIAAVGVAAVTPSVLARNTPASAESALALPAGADGAMVAYIQDVHAGELAVMVEGREVVVTDHDLVARLAHALHSGGDVAL